MEFNNISIYSYSHISPNFLRSVRPLVDIEGQIIIYKGKDRVGLIWEKRAQAMSARDNKNIVNDLADGSENATVRGLCKSNLRGKRLEPPLAPSAQTSDRRVELIPPVCCCRSELLSHAYCCQYKLLSPVYCCQY
jgi:hypothetical protein